MIIGNKIYHKKTVFNSLQWAKEESSTAPDGAVFLADIHERTKGRGNRTWKFDKEQLPVTILLKAEKFSRISAEELPLRLSQLNMAICLGILKPLKKFDITIKWANDFYYQKSKVGGMLTQSIWSKNKISSIIVGFAINVNNDIPKLEHSHYKAESIKGIIGKKVDKKILLQELLRSIDYFYKKWIDGNFDEIFSEWKENQGFIKEKVKVHNSDGTLVSGTFSDVTSNGDMILNITNKRIIVPFYTVDNVE